MVLLVAAGCSSSLDPAFDATDIDVDVSATGTGSGVVTATEGVGINCVVVAGDSNGACSDSFTDGGGGGSFRLEAAAGAGNTFVGWTGDCTGSTCVLSFPQGMDTSFDVTVRFDTIRPPNRPPAVRIDAPASGAMLVAGTSIEFRGSAIDPEDGSLTASLSWSSSIAGAMCVGADCESFTYALSPGTHIISLTATDADGAAGSASVSVTVVQPVANEPPAAWIALPETGSTYQVTDTVSFLGGGSDPEDGTLSGLAGQLRWTSSIDGVLCTCTSFRRMLSAGTHAISLAATDTQGATDTARVTVSVVQSNLPGSISGRVTGNGYAVGGATLTLSGASSATAASDDNGYYSFPSLPPGSYTITVSTPLSIDFPATSQTVTLLPGQALTVDFVGSY